MEPIVKRERILRVALVLVGLFYIWMVYPLATDLWQSKWLLVMQNETEPMFLSFFITLGVFLLLAARRPPAHRLLIAFAAWHSIAHASVPLGSWVTPSADNSCLVAKCLSTR
jgi:hypothetical protein